VIVTPPDTQVVISVQIFPDNLLEGEERFSVFIASSDEHVTTTQSTAQITIVDSSEGNNMLLCTVVFTKTSPCVVHLTLG
jgi:hypothetical protein